VHPKDLPPAPFDVGIGLTYRFGGPSAVVAKY